MHILVTRPEPFASQASQILIKRGHQVTKVPLLNVKHHPIPENLTPQTFDACVITSYQTLLTPGLERFKHLPLWAVGQKEKFIEAGWQNIQTFPDVKTLTQNMPLHKKWIYLRGYFISQKIRAPRITEHTCYTTQPIQGWPQDIPWSKLDAVMLMSQKTAQTFMEITPPHLVQNLIALCHSQAIAEVVASWPWKSLHIGTITT